MKLPATKRIISNGGIAIIFAIIFASNLTGCKKEKSNEPANDEIYTAVDQPAQFPDGIDSFYAFLTKNIHYPEQARRDNVQGKVFAQFVVEKDGSLSDIYIVRGIGDGCDEEVVRVLKLSPKWIPGKQNDVIVRTQYTIPVNFVLTTNQTASTSAESVKIGLLIQ